MLSGKKYILPIITFFLVLFFFIIIPIQKKHEEKEENRKFQSAFIATVTGKYEYRGYTIILDTTNSNKFLLGIGVNESIYKSIKIGDSLEKIKSSNSWKINGNKKIELDYNYRQYKKPPEPIEIITN